MITVIIRRRVVRIKRARQRDLVYKDADSDCEAPETPNRTIRILRGLRGKRLLTALLHEGIHAVDWNKSEREVDLWARNLARLLWATGWRLHGTTE